MTATGGGLEWRSLGWLPDYEISERGDVRRAVACRNQRKGRLLTPFKMANGYLRIGVLVQGKLRNILIHRLVCEAWHGPPPFDGAEVAHGDGNKSGNHYTNLRWATRFENAADRLLHGTHCRGERSPHATITWETARAIRALHTGKYGDVPRISEQFGLPRHVVSDIVLGRSWVEIGKTPRRKTRSHSDRTAASGGVA